MSKDWVKDLADMHDKFQFHEATSNYDHEMFWKILEFRYNFLNEELQEGFKAVKERDPEEVVDALIDLCVVAIGTLDLMKVDSYKAWDEVHKANMSKVKGMKETRKNDFGFPDLVKPRDWQKPSHKENHGVFNEQ